MRRNIKQFKMRKILLFLFWNIILLCGNYLKAQNVYEVIDSTDIKIEARINFIRNYFAGDREQAKEFWHPKYQQKKDYNYAVFIDAVSRNFSPKDIRKNNKLLISELEMLNDTLSYCKIEVFTLDGLHYLTYKYFIIDINGKLFFDNCLPYELSRFQNVPTEYLDFYISPYHTISRSALTSASKTVDSLYNVLRPGQNKEKFKIFMCSNIEEMDILSNMTKYYGYVGGFTNMEEKYAVYAYDSPIHKHEFVHLILGKRSGMGYILGEGIPTLYGGVSPQISYYEGRMELQEGYRKALYNFEKLYNREISNAKNNVPSYTIAAVVCEYIRRKFGLDELLALYYNPNINDDNLLVELARKSLITKERLIDEIEVIIFEK
ncbi:hypothetical protein GCM10022218_40470 [Sphingobacterium ginsenosidimutans]|uniref:Peptidase MA-like domain-containing protein n=2 Tax=Sphingobacterium ginsenosidimutans TaxID=687845 RepID=A0ABP8AF86_9SPHI